MTAAMPWEQGRNPRWDRVATRLAHWTPLLIFASAVSLTTARLTADGGWLVILSTTVVMALLFTLAVFVTVWHAYALCPVCARKTLLNPQAAITRRRRSLRAAHWATAHDRAYRRTLAALFVLSLVPYTSLVAFPAFMLAIAAGLTLDLIHMPLRPWCPQCRGRWEDGGDAETAPTPDPVGKVAQ